MTQGSSAVSSITNPGSTGCAAGVVGQSNIVAEPQYNRTRQGLWTAAMKVRLRLAAIRPASTLMLSI